MAPSSRHSASVVAVINASVVVVINASVVVVISASVVVVINASVVVVINYDFLDSHDFLLKDWLQPPWHSVAHSLHWPQQDIYS